MKRIVVALLVASILCSFCSCVENSYYNTPHRTTCAHDWEPATCTEPKTCSKCGETFGDALGHTTYLGTCKRCGETFSDWHFDDFVDEFQQPTGRKFIATYSYGTFSNSATSNSTLRACIQVTNSSVSIILWEYSDNIIRGAYSDDIYYITILDEAGERHEFREELNHDEIRIYFDDEEGDEEKILNLLKKSQTLKFYLENKTYNLSTYRFDINTAGFSELYNQFE